MRRILFNSSAGTPDAIASCSIFNTRSLPENFLGITVRAGSFLGATYDTLNLFVDAFETSNAKPEEEKIPRSNKVVRIVLFMVVDSLQVCPARSSLAINAGGNDSGVECSAAWTPCPRLSKPMRECGANEGASHDGKERLSQSPALRVTRDRINCRSPTQEALPQQEWPAEYIPSRFRPNWSSSFLRSLPT